MTSFVVLGGMTYRFGSVRVAEAGSHTACGIYGAKRSIPCHSDQKGMSVAQRSGIFFLFGSDSSLRCLLRKPNLVSPLANVPFRPKRDVCRTAIRHLFPFWVRFRSSMFASQTEPCFAFGECSIPTRIMKEVTLRDLFCCSRRDDISVRFCPRSGGRFAYRLRYLRSKAKYTLSFRAFVALKSYFQNHFLYFFSLHSLCSNI